MQQRHTPQHSPGSTLRLGAQLPCRLLFSRSTVISFTASLDRSFSQPASPAQPRPATHPSRAVVGEGEGNSVVRAQAAMPGTMRGRCGAVRSRLAFVALLALHHAQAAQSQGTLPCARTCLYTPRTHHQAHSRTRTREWVCCETPVIPVGSCPGSCRVPSFAQRLPLPCHVFDTHSVHSQAARCS